MSTSEGIKEFLKNKILAVVGVSRSEKKFSYRLFKELQSKGYTVYPINPKAEEINSEKCYNSFLSLPQRVNGIVIVLPPNQTEKVVNEAITLGIKNIWIQQGAESQRAIDICKENGINVIYKQCVLMYAEPRTFPHNLHFAVNKFLGKLPD